MRNMTEKTKTRIIVCLLALTLIAEFLPPLLKDERKNFFLSSSLPLFFGFIAFCILLNKEKSGLFKKPTNLLYLLPALIIAVDNFQFASYFAGKMQPVQADFADWILFASYCLLTGLFEETVFRGTVFPLIAVRFEKNKKGLLKTVILSSVLFGVAHLFNLFAGAGATALLQACYSTLTGALFAFVLIKTKNIVCCGAIHGLYNFCGLLFSKEQGLGAGVVFDFPTGLTMFIVSVLVAGFAIYSFIKYTEEERVEFYDRLGFGINTTIDAVENTKEKF